MAVNDDDPVRAIDMMNYDAGHTEIWVPFGHSAERGKPFDS